MAQSIIHPFEAIDIQHHHRQQLIRERLTLQRLAQSGTGIDPGLKIKISAQGQLFHQRVNRFDTGATITGLISIAAMPRRVENSCHGCIRASGEK
jgi:hypothetical protein